MLVINLTCKVGDILWAANGIFKTSWLPHDTYAIANRIQVTAYTNISLINNWKRRKQLVGSILEWRHNERDGVSNHQPRNCLLNRLFNHGSKKTSKLCVTGLCAGNSPMTGEFPAQMASNAENVSIWWRHHVSTIDLIINIKSILLIMFSWNYPVSARPGGRLNIKISSYQCRDPHVKDKTVSRPSYL